MTRFRIVATELAGQIALALVVGLGVSLVLAGATLVLAGDSATETVSARPAAPADSQP